MHNAVSSLLYIYINIYCRRKYTKQSKSTKNTSRIILTAQSGTSLHPLKGSQVPMTNLQVEGSEYFDCQLEDTNNNIIYWNFEETDIQEASGTSHIYVPLVKLPKGPGSALLRSNTGDTKWYDCEIEDGEGSVLIWNLSDYE